MILPDVNVLIYAFRSDSPDHEAYHSWLEQLVNGDSAYGMSPQVLCSVVRITTHPRIYARPSRREDTLDFARVLLDQPSCSVIRPGPRHWSLFEELCARAAATGNHLQDAWFAALALEWGCEWVTTDRDYSRFPGLRWRTPF